MRRAYKVQIDEMNKNKEFKDTWYRFRVSIQANPDECYQYYCYTSLENAMEIAIKLKPYEIVANIKSNDWTSCDG